MMTDLMMMVMMMNDILQSNVEVLKRTILSMPSLSHKILSQSELADLLAQSSVQLNEQEIVTLFRALDNTKMGFVRPGKVLKMLLSSNND